MDTKSDGESVTEHDVVVLCELLPAISINHERYEHSS